MTGSEKLSTKWTTRPERLVELAEMVRKTPWAEDYPLYEEISHDWTDHGDDEPFEKGVMFNMANYFVDVDLPQCRTVCCIAGLAALAWSGETRDALVRLRYYTQEADTIQSLAMAVLGMKDRNVAGELFLTTGNDIWLDGANAYVKLRDVAPEHAARVLILVARGVRPRDAWQRTMAKKDVAQP